MQISLRKVLLVTGLAGTLSGLAIEYPSVTIVGCLVGICFQIFLISICPFLAWAELSNRDDAVDDLVDGKNVKSLAARVTYLIWYGWGLFVIAVVLLRISMALEKTFTGSSEELFRIVAFIEMALFVTLSISVLLFPIFGICDALIPDHKKGARRMLLFFNSELAKFQLNGWVAVFLPVITALVFW